MPLTGVIETMGQVVPLAATAGVVHSCLRRHVIKRAVRKATPKRRRR